MPPTDIHVFGAVVSTQSLAVLAVATAAVVALHLFLHKTRLGVRCRRPRRSDFGAYPRHPGGSGWCSIPSSSTALVAVASILISPIYLAKFTNGDTLGLAAFLAAINWRLQSVRGAILGGVILGILIICRRLTSRRNIAVRFHCSSSLLSFFGGRRASSCRIEERTVANRVAAVAVGLLVIPASRRSFFLKPFGTYDLVMGGSPIAAIGLNLTLGYAGQVSLAQGAFVGIGALYRGVAHPSGLALPNRL